MFAQKQRDWPGHPWESISEKVPKVSNYAAQTRDVNEAYTVVIITDMLERAFGLNKYAASEDVSRL